MRRILLVPIFLVAVGLFGCAESEPYQTLPADLPADGEPPAAAPIGISDWKNSAASGDFHPTPLPN